MLPHSWKPKLVLISLCITTVFNCSLRLKDHENQNAGKLQLFFQKTVARKKKKSPIETFTLTRICIKIDSKA